MKLINILNTQDEIIEQCKQKFFDLYSYKVQDIDISFNLDTDIILKDNRYISSEKIRGIYGINDFSIQIEPKFINSNKWGMYIYSVQWGKPNNFYHVYYKIC